MKTTLLFIGVSLCLVSCGESDVVNPEELSTEEMKSTVEVEEIQFEEPKANFIAAVELREPKTIDPIYRGCVLEPGCLGSDEGLPLPREGDDEIIEGKPFSKPPNIRPVAPAVPIFIPKPPSKSEDFEPFPDVDAQYPGGAIEFKKFIQENIRHPEGDVSVQGTVYVSMIVSVEGKIQNVEVMRGISEELDAEALRVVRSMPNWIPAEDNGKIVAAKVRLPIRFSLN